MWFTKFQHPSSPRLRRDKKGPAEYFTGTVRIDPLLTRRRPITRRFPSDFAVYPPTFPARRIRGT